MQAPFYCDESTPLGQLIAASLCETGTPRAEFVAHVRSAPLSMLANDTLRAIHALSAGAEGSIIEVGAYVGGATLCILDATKDRDVHVVTLEEAVEHPTHPHIPTNDTVADLLRNIEAFGLKRPSHRILAGCSFETWVLGELHHQMIGRRASLLVWDADAAFDRDLVYLAPFLTDDCVLVVDDYMAEHAKGSRITRTIDRWTEAGIVEPVALLPWSTWFGQLRRKPSIAEIAETQRGWLEEAEAGDPYCQRLLDYIAALDGSGPTPSASKAERMAFWQKAIAHWLATTGAKPEQNE